MSGTKREPENEVGSGEGFDSTALVSLSAYISVARKHCLVTGSVVSSFQIPIALSLDQPRERFSSPLISPNRPFARSGHMVRNKLYWDANNAVGLSKQR